jgi:hypothetical protein
MYKNDFDHKAKMRHGIYLDATIRGERCVLHGGTVRNASVDCGIITAKRYGLTINSCKMENVDDYSVRLIENEVF